MNITLRIGAACALALAAGVHAGLIRAHLTEGVIPGIAFTAAAAFQIASAVALLLPASRAHLRVISLGNLAIVALWALTRSIGLPALGLAREPVMAHDLVTVTAEASALIALFIIASRTPTAPGHAVPSAAGIGLLTAMGIALAATAPLGHQGHDGHRTGVVAQAASAAMHAHGLRAPGEFDPGPPGRPRATGVSIPAGAQPVALAVSGRTLWSASREDGTVTRIQTPGARTTTISVGGRPSAITTGHGLVWLADFGRDRVISLDPLTMEQVGRPIPVDPGPTALATDRRSVWVVTAQEGTLQRIDPVRRTADRRARVGFGPVAIAIDEDALWIALSLDRAVVPVDRATLRVGRQIPTDAGTSAILSAHGRIWTANSTAGTVSVIDPDARAVTATVRVDDRTLPGRGPVALAADDDALWVANNHDKTIRALDPRTKALGPLTTFDDRLATSPIAVQLVIVDQSLWVTNAEAGAVLRVAKAVTRA